MVYKHEATKVITPTAAIHNLSYSGVNKIKAQYTPLNETMYFVYDADRRLIKVNFP
jgi:hypothetical protein